MRVLPLLLLVPLVGCVYVEDLETDVASFTIDDAISQVVIRADNGGVTVIGSGDAVSGELAMEWGGDAPEIDVWVEGQTAYVETRCAGWGPCVVEHALQVPEGASLLVELGDGVTSVRDVYGGVRIEADSGDVDLDRVGGMLEISTGAGAINGSDLSSGQVYAETGAGDVDLWLIDAVDEIEIDTGSGAVDLAVPVGSYRVEVDTGSGDIQLDNITVDQDAAARVQVSTGSGGVNIQGR